ncbi:MAG TPA: MBL fold metallo-hydrolase [Hypericibacter adhaerens]|jgi:phosphoribosyl 1,2-cyclic phosphate phosphodiesterase|uniref:Metal-dependent hydrolase n=1 Tax=Hypericibacter adhaerens TaxID=2602016 RepID=A0A5J6MY28_9PROT|nr:MBL fold metallo-hydrolase [Hypericibacter adhaerens]QEX22251.1 metal-dependent hydrolase [Hypericibacter adhaerens]HWA44079.1 MBL fold metallo-hydrolase [Hypericibacter adhaerens]
MRVTVLGCGGSGGVPLVGNHWGSCNPANPRNRRRRVSVLVETHGKTILIDASPDCRAQLLDANVKGLDAVLFTHDHADHVHGLDDLRFVRRDPAAPPLPVYATPETLATLAQRFDYVFKQNEKGSGKLYKPFLDPHPVELGKPFLADGVPVLPYLQDHGHGTISTGYRIGNFAYSTDVIELPEASLALLKGLDLLIVDCLRFEPHITHANFDKAMGWIGVLKPRHAVLTHLNHQIDYDALKARCPAGVEPGYDGLVVEVQE